MNNNEHISTRTLERLPAYHHFLRELALKNIEYVSTTQIAEQLNLKPIQVRKDIAVTGIIGKPKIGYHVDELIKSIEHFLGWDIETKAILVGCGNLGTSLLGYKGFERYGLKIIMAFDNADEKTGRFANGKPVFHIKDLTRKIEGLCIELGIITVPEKYAQETADILVENNIKAIWNFAPISLNVPQEVVVQQQDMAPCLAVLMNRVQYLAPCSTIKKTKVRNEIKKNH